MIKEELEELLEKYLFRIVYANDKYKLYYFLQERKSDRLEELNMAPAFFVTVFDALQQSFLIETFKLYDIKSDTGIIKLLNKCENSNKLFPTKGYSVFHEIDPLTDEIKDTLRDEYQINVLSDINKFRIELAEKDRVINNLRGQRDKYYAHLDNKYFNNQQNISIDYPLLFKDVGELLDFAGVICNTLLRDLCGRVISNNSMNYDDIKYILNSLHNSRIS